MRAAVCSDAPPKYERACTFHDLRSSLRESTRKVIQARLGHASIKTTLDTYGHLFDGPDEAAADRLDEVWQASDMLEVQSMHIEMRRRHEVLALPG